MQEPLYFLVAVFWGSLEEICMSRGCFEPLLLSLRLQEELCECEQEVSLQLMRDGQGTAVTL